jgi:hypothetical protein
MCVSVCVCVCVCLCGCVSVCLCVRVRACMNGIMYKVSCGVRDRIKE